MHDVSDPRNASILINVNGELKPRAEAFVSVFDSGFMLGDGVWEGLRVHRGKLGFLDRHLDRLFEGAKAIAMDVGLSREELAHRLYETLDANGMEEGAHVRLMVTRGVRSTPYQDPRVVVTPATIVIIAEYKEPDPTVYERGLKLFTVHVRRGDPAVQDQKINSHSKLNCILASVQATQAGARIQLSFECELIFWSCTAGSPRAHVNREELQTALVNGRVRLFVFSDDDDRCRCHNDPRVLVGRGPNATGDHQTDVGTLFHAVRIERFVQPMRKLLPAEADIHRNRFGAFKQSIEVTVQEAEPP